MQRYWSAEDLFRGNLAGMKALEDKILNEGTVLPGDILKVGSFLNHQLDVAFLLEMGQEIARLYQGEQINKILTIETSGIAIAVAAAAFMKIPVVFAKKNRSSNIDCETYTVKIHSYTHNNDYDAVVSKAFLNAQDRVLIIDDFLANGQALGGLLNIVEQAGATTVGVAVAIEKGFQHGGDKLREQGIRVESLAIIDSMDSNTIKYREQA